MGKTTRIRIAPKEVGKADFFAVPCFERKAPDTDGTPPPIARAARKVAEKRGFSARSGQAVQNRGRGAQAPTTVVVGLGKSASFDRAGLRTYLGRAVAQARAGGFRNPVVALPSHPELDSGGAVEDAVRTLALSGYRFDAFLSKKTPTGQPRQIAVTGSESAVAHLQEGLARAQEVARGVATTRDLANTPPNEAFPEAMAERAKEIAEAGGMKATILGPKQLEKRGMGGILAVGRGSRKSPRLVLLEWGDGDERISLVGKGVTFDTGGISIKPSPAMDEMKFDKSGACAVLGISAAAAALDLPFRFRSYLPFAENMPDGDAYRPGDIVRCYGGKTVEILNTDAEGRMLLADALALAVEDGSDCIVDYATLTGACVVALGGSGAGLFTHDDALADELLEAAGGAGENLWRLPLWREFSRQMKGAHADLRNTGSRWGGASTAAAFLSAFVGKASWAHLDIAGPSYVGRADSRPFGATGYGVATTITWLLSRLLRAR